MKSPWISGLRSVALTVPDLAAAETFYTQTWKLAIAARGDGVLYLRGSGSDHHLLALHAAAGLPQLLKVTLRARGAAALDAIAQATLTAGGRVERAVAAATDPAGGQALVIRDGDGRRIEIPLKQAQEYARPECHHCGDFSAELADISCGGVGAMDWTIVVLRTERGEALFDRAAAEGIFEVRPMNEFETSMKVLLRLARKQRQRVPTPPGRADTFVRPTGFTNPH